MESHLLQMRGLKPECAQRNFIERQSHLLQMRGLKHFLSLFMLLTQSRIFYRCVD